MRDKIIGIPSITKKLGMKMEFVTTRVMRRTRTPR